jgi:hypothetical protein
MAADVLMANVNRDAEGPAVSLRVVGTQIPPVKMSVQIAITGRAAVQIQGRIHKDAPWADIGAKREESCLFYIDPVWSLRAVTSATSQESSVSVWATWGL